MSEKIVVAGFGSTANTNWREPFEKEFNSKDVNFYNPVVENWNPNYHPRFEAQIRLLLML